MFGPSQKTIRHLWCRKQVTVLQNTTS